MRPHGSKYNRMTIYCPESLITYLKEIAEASGRPVSQICVETLQAFIDKTLGRKDGD